MTARQTDRTDSRTEQKASTTALQYAVKLLSTRPYTERKLREKLYGRQYTTPEIRSALDRLKRERLLDDRKYAEDYVHARMAARPRAATRMVTDLLARGIPLALAREVTAELMPKSDELTLAREFVRRKQAQYAHLDEDTRWRRLAGMLARRGFSLDTIRAVLKQAPDDISEA
jgi:regulatory protein